MFLKNGGGCGGWLHDVRGQAADLRIVGRELDGQGHLLAPADERSPEVVSAFLAYLVPAGKTKLDARSNMCDDDEWQSADADKGSLGLPIRGREKSRAFCSDMHLFGVAGECRAGRRPRGSSAAGSTGR